VVIADLLIFANQPEASATICKQVEKIKTRKLLSLRVKNLILVAPVPKTAAAQ